MATQITADRFTELKARVKAECLRRSGVGEATGSTSVASYGGTAYDYSTTPATGGSILQEHRDKIATPLHAINSSIILTATGQTSISDADLTAMEAFTTNLEIRSLDDDSGTDCAGGCTGLCYGCASTCYSECQEDCTGACSGACSQDCTGACAGTCSAQCMFETAETY